MVLGSRRAAAQLPALAVVTLAVLACAYCVDDATLLFGPPFGAPTPNEGLVSVHRFTLRGQYDQQDAQHGGVGGASAEVLARVFLRVVEDNAYSDVAGFFTLQLLENSSFPIGRGGEQLLPSLSLSTATSLHLPFSLSRRASSAGAADDVCTFQLFMSVPSYQLRAATHLSLRIGAALPLSTSATSLSRPAGGHVSAPHDAAPTFVAVSTPHWDTPREIKAGLLLFMARWHLALGFDRYILYVDDMEAYRANDEAR